MITSRRRLPRREAPVKDPKDLLDRYNDDQAEGTYLEKGTNGAIITVTLAPNETKSFSHGLRAVPKYRLVFSKTGNGDFEDVPSLWTDRVVVFKNNSANTLVMNIKLFQG